MADEKIWPPAKNRPAGELFRDPPVEVQTGKVEAIPQEITHIIPGMGWLSFVLGIWATSEVVEVALQVVRLVKGMP